MEFIKKNKDLFIILSLIILVIISFVAFSYSLAFFSTSKKTVGEITLAELDYEIELTSTHSGNIMPGDTVDVDIVVNNAVKNKTSLVPFYFRFKVLSDTSDYSFFNLVLDNEDNFVQKDNYYYYKNKLNPNQKVKVLDAIVIDHTLTQEDKKDFSLKILVDAVQSEFGAYKEIFSDAPQEWLDFVENN